MKKLPVVSRDGRRKIACAASARISGERLIAATLSPPSRLRTAAVSIAVSGHSEFTAMPSLANSALMPSVHIDMPNFAIV